MTVSVGLGILTGQVPPGAGTVRGEYQAMPALAAVAEDAGYDSVWASEHHFAPDSYLPSILPLLAAIASRTQRVRLGAAAVVAPFHHPIRLAEDAAVVDNLSGGRLELALVNGWRDVEFEGFGIPQAERASRLEHTVAVLRACFAGERVQHQAPGRHAAPVRVFPLPCGEVPIWIGGFAASAAERAGRVGDGYIASSDAPVAVARRFEAARRGRAGRAGLRLAVMLDVALDGTAGAVDGYRYKQEVYRTWRDGRTDPIAWPLGPGDPDDLLIRGDTEGVAAALSSYVQLAEGEDLTLIVRLHFPGMAMSDSVTAVRRFAAEVVPQVRKAAL